MSDFKPMIGITIEVVVLKGKLFKDSDRITSKIRTETKRRKLNKPNATLACLIRNKFTDKIIEDMGLRWIVVMHKPINDDDGLLSVGRGDGGRRLVVHYGRPDVIWKHDYGFAFVKPCNSQLAFLFS